MFAYVCSKGWLYRSFRLQMGGTRAPPTPPPPLFLKAVHASAVRHFRSMLHVHGMLSLLFIFVLRIFPQVFIMHRASSFPSSESSFHDYQTILPHQFCVHKIMEELDSESPHSVSRRHAAIPSVQDLRLSLTQLAKACKSTPGRFNER